MLSGKSNGQRSALGQKSPRGDARSTGNRISARKRSRRQAVTVFHADEGGSMAEHPGLPVRSECGRASAQGRADHSARAPPPSSVKRGPACGVGNERPKRLHISRQRQVEFIVQGIAQFRRMGEETDLGGTAELGPCESCVE